jgi:predicted lipoprotein with Yx(FWY)xxD motif
MHGRRRKSLCALLATALAFGLLGTGVAQAGVAKIKVSNTLRGAVITDARGYVLFMFSNGGHSIARCEKIKTCTADWTGKIVK